MTPSELKYQIERAGHDPHFFTRKTMQFFGDTMRNYGVRTRLVCPQLQTVQVEVWELYRKHPVKHGLQSSAYFKKDTFERVFPMRGEK